MLPRIRHGGNFNLLKFKNKKSRNQTELIFHSIILAANIRDADKKYYSKFLAAIFFRASKCFCLRVCNFVHQFSSENEAKQKNSFTSHRS